MFVFKHFDDIEILFWKTVKKVLACSFIKKRKKVFSYFS
jgi:hypothetical protein